MHSQSIVTVTEYLAGVNHGKITKTPVKKANVKQEAFQSPESSNLEWDALVRISDELDF